MGLRGRFQLWWALAGISAALPMASARADECDPMKFSLATDSFGNDIIFAAGDISGDKCGNTVVDFKTFLDTQKLAPVTTVVFNSPGGEPFIAMKLARIIRQLSLQTSVGRRAVGRANPNSTKLVDTGYCASACTLAFLGGVRRTVPPGSRYGIHAIDSVPSPDSPAGTPDYQSGVFAGQEMAGDISQFLEEMGVDPEWLFFFSRYDSRMGRVLWVPQDLLEKWHVLKTSIGTKWEIIAKDENFYFIGANPDTTSAPHQHDEIYIVCGGPHAARLGAVYLPSPKESASLLAPTIHGYALAMPTSHPGDFNRTSDDSLSQSLEFNDAEISQKAHTVLDDPRLYAEVNITPRVMALLDSSGDINFRFLEFGPIYVSVTADFGAAERDTLKAFVKTCK